MRVPCFGLYLVLSLFLWATPLLATDSSLVEPSPPPREPPPVPEYLMSSVPPVERIGPGRFRMGEIVIDKKERSISFPAQANLKDGPLEYLLVHRRGKVHESLLRTDVEPYYLNLAFLLLNFESTDRPLKFQGDDALPQGEPVSITVSLQGTGGAAAAQAPERWLVLKRNESAPEEKVAQLSWIYTGARIWNGRFAAQTGGSIIAVYHDPDALVDHTSPGGDNDRIWFVNSKTVPPVATPVTITIKSAR